MPTSTDLTALRRYRRAVDYLAAAQVYLKSNALLREPLQPEHVKERLLGHWGTTPGLNLIYAHLNRLILDTEAEILLVTGPGHGAAANLANLYLEGTLTQYYPEMTHDLEGLERFVSAFSRPGGFPSHLFPGLPGVINEGGELGYALAISFGAALDNPDLIVACIVGDGEAETGATATAWHSNKFLNPASDGAVLPIVHLNGFKISQPTIYGTMTDEELTALFTGYGYAPRIVDYSDHLDEDCIAAFDWAHGEIRAIQDRARKEEGTAQAGRPRWPVLLLRTPKGMGCPLEIDGVQVEGSFHAHQVPAKELRTNPQHLKIVEQWLRTYKPEELWDEEGRPAADILAACPQGDRRMAENPHGHGGRVRQPLDLPPVEDYAITVSPRGAPAENMVALGDFLRDLLRRDQRHDFRIVCPDELVSNRLGAVLEATDRQYVWPVPPQAEHISPRGQVLEVLSEHDCQAWLQGYLLTGRHGLYPCYEAFVSIVDTMLDQYAKFIKASLEVPWREPVSSLNYLLTSVSWRQDHNGYSHQGPGFINNLLTKKGHTYHIYLPPDSNTLVATMEHCLRQTSYVNLVVASKQDMPQWLSMSEAREHFRAGASIWPWAGTNGGEDPELVFAGCGDHLTLEAIAAVQLLREEAPEWRTRVVNVVNLLSIAIPQKYPAGLEEKQFQRLFPLDVPVIFNFHGYTAAIKQLLWERPQQERFDINGYREEGTTTTPFDMHVLNRTSRYHLIILAAEKMAQQEPSRSGQCEALVRKYRGRLEEHRNYILEHGMDPPEIADWQWSAE
ncbi:MAG: phosphoketolase family protein [candidate division WS1 bacterium]|nr:phosphoketolase family protein [candidate division WS1 bacterium]